MKRYIFLFALLLTACVADGSSGGPASVLPMLLPPKREPDVQLTGSGAEFFGRFSTNGALNSMQSFISSYHGEIRITLLPNGKIACRWWAEGRIQNPTVYSGSNDFIEAFSTLCVGKLQRDGSFEFRGVYMSKDPVSAALSEGEKPDDTFTLNGSLLSESIRGSLIVGGVYAIDHAIQDTTTLLTETNGMQYEAVLVEM